MKCELENIDINYETYGEGKPVIIIHGFEPDHRLMTGCLEPIFEKRQGWKRIYIDLPGMGKTEGKEWITNSDLMLEVVIKFIEKVIPKQSFLLVGQSYGGYLARGIVHNKMKLVEGLLLICPVIIPQRTNRNISKHTILEIDKEFVSKLDPHESEVYKAISVIQNKNTWQRYKGEILCGVKIADERFLSNLSENGYSFSFNPDILPRKFDKPTTFILGRQDLCVGYKDAWNIFDNYTRGCFAVVDKAGHNLQVEQEELFNNLVKEWLDRLEDRLK